MLTGGGGGGSNYLAALYIAYTQFIRNYSPQSGGTAGTLIFWFQVSGMALY